MHFGYYVKEIHKSVNYKKDLGSMDEHSAQTEYEALSGQQCHGCNQHIDHTMIHIEFYDLESTVV